MDVDLSQITQTNYLLNLGINQYSIGDFPNALQTLKKASSQLLKEKQYNKYLHAQNLRIIICTEIENFDEITNIRNELVEVIWNHQNLGTSYARLHYSLGFCFLRQKNNIKAQVQFDQGLAEALKLQKQSEEQKDQKKLLIAKISVCYISYGFACLYTLENKIMEAIQELKNMDTLIGCLTTLQLKIKEDNLLLSNEKSSDDLLMFLEHSNDEMQSLEFAHNLLKAQILKMEKKYDSAEKLFWLCYEQSQRNHRRRYMFLHLFYFLGKNYMEKGDYEQATIFLNLANKSVNPLILKAMHRKITQALQTLKEKITNNYDIVVNLENKMIVEKQKGHINIKNQFILLDMLKLFISTPGMIYSKESLVEKIWKQKYDPRVHDNKIYVTIKRLRELVEPDHKKPKYIFRTKDGYYMNQKVKVLLK